MTEQTALRLSLADALDQADHPAQRYHIRQAIQYCAIETNAEVVSGPGEGQR